MRRHVEASNPMKPRKREREPDSESRHHRSQSEAPQEPSPTPHRPNTPIPLDDRRKRSKRALDADRDRSATKRRQSPAASETGQSLEPRAEPRGTWFLDYWLGNTPGSVQEVKGGGVPTIDGLPESEAGRDRTSLQDAESTQMGGSAASERLETSSPMYRGALRMNGIVVDDFGTKMPRDVEELVAKHIRKERASPPLEEDEKASIRRKMQEVWDSPEPTVSDMVTAPLFDLANPALAPGRDVLWSPEPLPQSPDYPLVTPRTDRHLGFQPTLKSGWTRAELAAADHPKVRPYSQPTRENLFPSFLLEVESEAAGGTLYAAEGQLATAGFHRVSSLMWILDQIDPARTRSSCDAVVFSAAVCQREAVAHVHYYNTEDETFYMSYVDSFYFAKDAQGCHDYVKNVVDWLVEVQQPMVRDALRALHPITQLWKKTRSASAADSFRSESDRSAESHGWSS